MLRDVVARARRRGTRLGRRRAPDVLLVGWDDLGAALGCSARQAHRYAARRVDPLPVWYLHEDGPPRVLRSRLDAWRRRNLAGGRGERKVRRWAEICRRVELSRTAAWAAMRFGIDPLPVFIDADGHPWAWASALVDWTERRRRTYRQRREQRALVAAAGRMRSGAEPEASTGDRARSATGVNGRVKMEKVCSPQKAGRRAA
jgi:hypothetical protein